MPVEVKGALNLRKALKTFTPDLAKEVQKELGALLKPITTKARGFIPGDAPLSGWAANDGKGVWANRAWDSRAAKRGIGYKTTPSKPNRQGFRALARIVNNSAAGSIYETAGRKNAQGQPNPTTRSLVTRSSSTTNADFELNLNVFKSDFGNKKFNNSRNPNAGKQFIDALNADGVIVDASNQTGAGRRSRKMRGRAIFRAWKEDGGKTNAAVIKAIEGARDKFNAAVKVR